MALIGLRLQPDNRGASRHAYTAPDGSSSGNWGESSTQLAEISAERDRVTPIAINVPIRIVPCIPIDTRSIHKPQRICLRVAAEAWIVVSMPVVMQARVFMSSRPGGPPDGAAQVRRFALLLPRGAGRWRGDRLLVLTA